MLTPLIVIFFALTALFFTLFQITKLIKKKYRNKQTLTNVVVFAILWSLQFSALLPKGDDAAKYRLQQFSEQDYQTISKEVNEAYKKFANNAAYFSRHDDGYDDFINHLSNKHQFFNLSSFPIDVYRRSDGVYIEWASGLTGGYEVVIFDASNPPKWFSRYELLYIYDSVAFYYKS
jgi:hypothetical protein